jgi:hypothetical protein
VKVYSQVGPRLKQVRMMKLLERTKDDEDEEKDLLMKLQKKWPQDKTNDNLDFNLACLSLKNMYNMSDVSYRKLWLWIKDVIRRGGDLSKMPSVVRLNEKTKELLPKEMEVNSVMAKVSLKDLLEHTICRILVRPDVYQNLDDGDAPEYVGKGGNDS